jgi:hypothetical protein
MKLIRLPVMVLVAVGLLCSCDGEEDPVDGRLAPPGTVDDLAIDSVTATTITLRWTAPGDDGDVGQASSYVLKRSDATITPTNFSAATTVSGVPAPASAGTVETFTVDGLDSTLVYYFALRTGDDDGLLSDVSNNATWVPGGPIDYTYEVFDAFANLSFSRPVDVQHAGDGSNRLFVVEQDGVIRVFPNDPMVSSTSEFLNITARVACCGEMGLLGLAFHPNYENNGFFFLHYSTNNPTRKGRVSRFRVGGNPNQGDPNSEVILLEFDDRQSNHNGGAMFFGGDGYLYIAIGDEGGGGDLYDNAQNRSVLFGKILRLDVDQNVNTIPYYGIPPSNPFVGNTDGYREEIFAYGLRNPWRISYDAATDRIWAGDVGQVRREEIDIIVNGANYGWDCREGFDPYTGPPGGPSPLCAGASGFTDPVWDYPRGEGQSITGGYVYRGPTVTSLVGKYVYADYISAHVWALTYDGAVATNEFLVDVPANVSSFGVGQNGELFVCGYDDGGIATKIYRLRHVPVVP